jgi:hypothetical protein
MSLPAHDTRVTNPESVPSEAVSLRESDAGDIRRIHFLMLCARDFWDVGIAVDYLLAVAEDASNMRVRRMVEVGAIVGHARPFTHTNWESHLELSPGLDPEAREGHQSAGRTVIPPGAGRRSTVP